MKGARRQGIGAGSYELVLVVKKKPIDDGDAFDQLRVLVHEFDNLPRLPHGEHDEVPEGKGSAKRDLAVLSSRYI